MDTQPFGYAWECIEGHWLWMEICARCYKGPVSGSEIDQEEGNICRDCENELDSTYVDRLDCYLTLTFNQSTCNTNNPPVTPSRGT